jgi:hypothetical protein
MQKPVSFAPRRGMHWLILTLGFGMIALGLAMPMLLPDKDVWMLVLILPTLVCGAIALVQGWCALRAKLEVGTDGLYACVPRWAGGMYPPLRSTVIPWSDIKSLHHRRRTYTMLGISMPVDELVLSTGRGDIVVAPAFCRNLPDLAAEIAKRIEERNK